MKNQDDMQISPSENTLREVKVKPFSKNVCVAFFQRIYRHWLGIWNTFSEKRTKLATLLYKIFFFTVFSVGVTLLQYLLMLFLPYAFKSLNDGPWGLLNVPVKSAGGTPYVLIGDASGLGYFIAFEIAVFLAQCINFPLQRNVTFHSHGNVFFQALWYFLGWIFVSVFTSALWGIFNCYLLYWNAPAALIGLVKTLLTGLMSFVIFFFIFLIIFPDREKQARQAQKRYERLKKRDCNRLQCDRAREKAERLASLAKIERARNVAQSAKSLATAKAIAWQEAMNRLQKAERKKASEECLEEWRERASRRFSSALDAAKRAEEAQNEYEKAVNETALTGSPL